MPADYRVKLRSITSRDLVVFDVTPEIQESRSVDYKATNLIHTPGAIMTYGFTNSREFSIGNARLVSRTPDEALNNMKKLQILRSWAMPYFGSQSSTSTSFTLSNGTSEEKLGAPPEILFLYAYAKELDQNRGNTYSHTRLTNIQHVPVVLTQLTIQYPSDVDYIPTSDTSFAIDPILPNDTTLPNNTAFNTKNAGISMDFSGGNSEPFPTIMSVNMTLVETHSPIEYSKFSLKSYKAGILTDF